MSMYREVDCIDPFCTNHLKYNMTKTINALRIGFVSAATLLAVIFVFSATVPKAQAALSGQLGLGSKGNNVTQLQEFLATNSSIYPEGLVTGYFGPMTAAAVVQFQAAYDIPQAGRVGPMTLDKINAVMAAGFGLDVNGPDMTGTYLQPSRTAATIGWNTNEAARGQVYYDVNPIRSDESTGHAQAAYVSGTQATTDSNVHNTQAINVQNLQPNTLYYYMTRSIDNSGNVSMTMPNTFRTSQ